MTFSTRRSSWLPFDDPVRDPLSTLFCFPFAGGGASAYRNWIGQFSPEIRVCPVQLPGRESRFAERPFTDMAVLADNAAEALVPHIQSPFILFGHSMGAVLAFEVARCLRTRGAPEPALLVVASRLAPQLPIRDNILFNLPDSVLVEKLRRLGGSPKSILDDPEMMAALLPCIRADFQVVETYTYQPAEPLSCPILALAGSEDPDVGSAELDPWGEQTTGEFWRLILPGDHFVILSSPTEVIQTVRERARKILAVAKLKPPDQHSVDQAATAAEAL